MFMKMAQVFHFIPWKGYGSDCTQKSRSAVTCCRVCSTPQYATIFTCLAPEASQEREISIRDLECTFTFRRSENPPMPREPE
jgi:hypothetical protein